MKLRESSTRLEKATEHLFNLLSENMQINTFCITRVTDEVNSEIIYVFNRRTNLLEPGQTLALGDSY